MKIILLALVLVLSGCASFVSNEYYRQLNGSRVDTTEDRKEKSISYSFQVDFIKDPLYAKTICEDDIKISFSSVNNLNSSLIIYINDEVVFQPGMDSITKSMSEISSIKNSFLVVEKFPQETARTLVRFHDFQNYFYRKCREMLKEIDREDYNRDYEVRAQEYKDYIAAQTQAYSKILPNNPPLSISENSVNLIELTNAYFSKDQETLNKYKNKFFWNVSAHYRQYQRFSGMLLYRDPRHPELPTVSIITAKYGKDRSAWGEVSTNPVIFLGIEKYTTILGEIKDTLLFKEITDKP